MIGQDLLKGDEIELVALAPTHASAIVQWFHNAEFMRSYSSATALPKTEEDVLQIIEKYRRSETQCMFGLQRRTDHLLVGMGGFDKISWRNGVGFLALAIDPQHWAKGYGTETLQLLLRFAFMEINLHKVQLTVFAYNERALALYSRAGFVREGTYREFIRRDGQRFDMILMGLLESEWQESVT